MMFKRPAALLLAPLLLAATSCSPTTAEESGPKIVTAFYALEYAANQVVGDAYEVVTLTMPGVDAHDLELSPSQIASLGEADLVIHLKGFQPAVDEAIEQSGATAVLDVSEAVHLLTTEDGHDHDHDHDDHEGDDHDDHDHEGDDHDHGEHDPHFWLDPERMADVADAIAESLGGDEQLRSNAEAMRQEMAAIDEEYRLGLADCERDEFITSHAAFHYLADTYGLTEIGINGITPNSEASPARIAEVHELAREHGITTIFFETLASDAVAKSIAGDLGLVTAVLDPLEGLGDQSPGSDYPSIMRANLDALQAANGCG